MEDRMADEWIRCPVFSNKIRGKIRIDTILINYPLGYGECMHKVIYMKICMASAL